MADQFVTPTSSPEKKGRAAPNSNDDQFKFLISCIRHGVNGKVDFTEVAKECGIVSKGAAAKRYERMMKAHGIHQPAVVNPRDASVASTKRGKANSTTTNSPASKNAMPAGKKRKAIFEDNMDGDDEEPSPKPKKKAKKEEPAVKSEVKKEFKKESATIATVPQLDGAFDGLSVGKSESHITIKSEPVLDMAAIPAHTDSDAIMTIHDAKLYEEKFFAEFLTPFEPQIEADHDGILIVD